MSGSISRKIERKEVLFYFDAANEKCYDGESEIGYGLALGTTASILTGVTWSADRSGKMTLNGTYSLGLVGYSRDSWISCGNRVPLLAPTFPITMEAWVKPRSLGGAASVVTYGVFALDSQEQYPGNYYGVDISLGSNNGTDTHTLTAGYFNGLSSGSGGRRSAVSTSRPVLAGTWSHIAAVFGGLDDIRLYVNGATVSGSLSGENFGGIAWSSTGKTVIGKPSGYYKYIFDGDIAMVRAYNLELTSAEIKSNYDLHARRFERI